MAAADVIVRLCFLLPPGLKGSQTQALSLDTDLLAIGTSHHTDPPPRACTAGMRTAGPLPGMLFSLLPTFPPEVLSSSSNTVSSGSSPQAPPTLLHPTKPPGPKRLQTRATGGQRRGLQANERVPGSRATRQSAKARKPVPPNWESGDRPPQVSHLSGDARPRLTRFCAECGGQAPAALSHRLAHLGRSGRPSPTPDARPMRRRCPRRPSRWPRGLGLPARHVPAAAPARLARLTLPCPRSPALGPQHSSLIPRPRAGTHRAGAARMPPARSSPRAAP